MNTQQQTANTADQNEMRDVVAAAAAAGAAAEERAVAAAKAEQSTLADLQAQKRAIIEQLKVAKAASPKPEKAPKPERTLADVIERQEASIGIGHALYVAQRALARVKLGQDVDGAVNEVAAREAEAAKGALTLMATGDYASLRDALMAWAAVNAPLTVVKQHTAISEGDESSDTTDK